jgi:IS1 family transposase
MFRLGLNGAESATRISHAKNSYCRQDGVYEDAGTCYTERPSINERLTMFFSFGFGGFLLALGATEYVNDERRVLRSSMIALGLGCSDLALLFLFMAGLYPYTWGLPPQWLPAEWNPCKQSNQGHQFSHWENVSQKPLHPDLFLYYTNYMANILSKDRQIAAVGALAEGSSIRSIERITGIHRDTIMRLGIRVGTACAELLDIRMRNLSCRYLQFYEIWGFIGKKERHMRFDDDPQYGDVWKFCAIDADTKLVPVYKVGKRDRATARAFVSDLAGRVTNRVQISSDALGAYVDAIERSFGPNVDFGQIVKTYEQDYSRHPEYKYSAPKCISVERREVTGCPNVDMISTSYVERLNATTRLHMRRLTRLTLAFSKRLENFKAAVALHFAYYKFVKRHNTLRCTPAMAAGIERDFWSVEDLIKVAA